MSSNRMMSTNPFDDDNTKDDQEEWKSSFQSNASKKDSRRGPTRAMLNREDPSYNNTSSSSVVSSRGYTNPRSGSGSVGSHHHHLHHHQLHGSSIGSSSVSSGKSSSPLWMARPVEWPLVHSLASNTYHKLWRTSKQIAGKKAIEEELEEDNQLDAASSTTGYFGLSGMMGRVFTSTNTTGGTGGGIHTHPGNKDEGEEDSGSSSNVRPRSLKSPKHGCVAASNGWIVACMECSTNPGMRLLSRWNIKAGGGSSTEKILPLPSPLLRGDASIAHIFVDPTGNHILLSSKNGEAYYLHSSTPRISKLQGFGGDHTGMAAADIPILDTSATGGSSASSSQQQHHHHPDQQQQQHLDQQQQQAIQQGLSGNSYVTAVAWDKQMGTEGSTKKILLGTSIGEIYEYSLMSPAMASSNIISKNTKPHTDDNSLPLPLLLVRLFASSESAGGGEGAVTGLHFERISATKLLLGSSASSNHPPSDIVVLAATSGPHKRTRLHTFRSMMQQDNFRHVFTTAGGSFVELPGSIDFADLKVCGDGFAMRTETGIYYGTLDKSPENLEGGGGTGTGIMDAGMLPYDNSSIPVSIAITSHHFVILLKTHEVRFINRVAKQVVQKERVDWLSMSSTNSHVDDGILAQGDAGELMMDIRRPDQIWLRKSRTLVHITSSNESRDVWKFTLQKCIDAVETSRPHSAKEEKSMDAPLEHAKSLCCNNTQRAVVTAFRAEYHLRQGRVELAARYMAQCPPSILPFANTATRLALPILGVDNNHNTTTTTNNNSNSALSESHLGLMTYLSDKLRQYKAQNDMVASSMIGAWLTELHLHERSSNKNKSLLHQFLTANVYHMDAKTTLRILSSHDAPASECASYAAAAGEIGTAVNAALCIDDKITGAMDALRVLRDAPFEQAEPHYYKHASLILSRVPMAAAKSFLVRYSDGLSPTKLLPAFMHYERKSQTTKTPQHTNARLANKLAIDNSKSFGAVEIRLEGNQPPTYAKEDGNASVKYLEGVIAKGCQSTAVFNFLISLYANMEDEDPLFRFLSTHVPAASAILKSNKQLHTTTTTTSTDTMHRPAPPLDMSYALRVILRSGRHYRSAVKLYMGFEMRQQAVELAIKVDPSLARELARESVGAEEQKKLWLMIARNAAADGDSDNVVSKVLSVLNDCGPDILSIEDVLPFMPDVAQIDQFKDEICSALTSYSSKIDGYWKEMNECDQTCDALRDEITRLGNATVQVKADAKCAFTKQSVLQANEPFYVFPSGFVALERALLPHVLPYLNALQKDRVQQLRTDLSKLQLNTYQDSQLKSELQSELDGLIAAECPFTGSMMVNSIDRGFL